MSDQKDSGQKIMLIELKTTGCYNEMAGPLQGEYMTHTVDK